ncbi:MAG TPA: universal stress protein [Polyangiaceae bacterium]|nr:universal stress protein [Polyangiaceae bacterium]
MLFRQLYDLESSTYTYLLADPDTREAVLIDPVLENVERDVGLLKDLGLTLRYALDTHVHADHVTALGTLHEQTGCQTVLSERAGVGVADVYVKDGDRLRFGRYELEARETPGHTSGCVTYVLGDRSMAFTGDALLIRGSGRTDFQQGDAGTLYRSVHDQIFSLPDSTLLYPGHDYKGRTVTSVGEEKRLNPRLGGGKTAHQFAEIMSQLQLAYPKKIDVALPANLQLGLKHLPVSAEVGEGQRWAPITRSAAGIPEVLPEWVLGNRDAVRLVDVREADELMSELGHIERVEHVPLATLQQVFADAERDQPLVVVCRSGGRSGKAALQLEALGFSRVGSMRGGMVEWTRRRFPTTRSAVPKTSHARAGKVAFATDLRQEEQPALYTATALAVHSQAKLVTVHATREGEAQGTLSGAAELARDWQKELQLESFVHTCCEDVTDTLLDALRRVEPDVIVCGTHHRGGLSQLLSGSVAEAVARNVNVPTLVIPLDGEGLATRRGELRVSRVLVPAGDAESARVGLAAVEWWIRSTRQERPEIVLLEVEDGSALPALASLPPGTRLSRGPANGSLEAAIEKAARDLDTHLIVMPTRGHDGIKDALLGSRTERVLRTTTRPVLIVPMDAKL